MTILSLLLTASLAQAQSVQIQSGGYRAGYSATDLRITESGSGHTIFSAKDEWTQRQPELRQRLKELAAKGRVCPQGHRCPYTATLSFQFNGAVGPYFFLTRSLDYFTPQGEAGGGLFKIFAMDMDHGASPVALSDLFEPQAVLKALVSHNAIKTSLAGQKPSSLADLTEKLAHSKQAHFVFEPDWLQHFCVDSYAKGLAKLTISVNDRRGAIYFIRISLPAPEKLQKQLASAEQSGSIGQRLSGQLTAALPLEYTLEIPYRELMAKP